MLAKYRTPSLSLAGTCAVLVFVAWVISGSQSFQTCFQENKRTNTYQSLYENGSVISKMIVRTRLNGECGVHFFGDESSAITSLATLLIAAFTFTLWRATDKMWIAGEKQLKIAADALGHTISVDNTTQRAYIGRVSTIQLKPYTTNDGVRIVRVEYTPTWENNGQTPAIDVTFCALEPIICNGDSDIPANVEPTPIKMGVLSKIAIGSRQTMQGGSVAIGIDDVIKCSRRNCRIFLVFRLEYRDVFPNTPLRVTQYCEEMRFSGVDPVDNIPRQPFQWPFTLFGHPRFQIFS
jgi:hypothetical protein